MTYLVDFHTHHACPAHPALAPRNAPAPLARDWAGIADRVGDLVALRTSSRDGGVDHRVLSAPPSMVTPPGERTPPDVVRRLNDHLASVVAGSPDLFSGLATVDAFAGEAAAREVRFAVRELGLAGVVVDCATDTELLGAASARPALEAAAELGVPVFAHPISHDVLTRLFADLGRFGTSLARGTVNAAALLSLLTGGALEALPGLRLVVPMLGISGLALAAAADDGEIITAAAGAGRAHVYVDTMGFAPASVRFAVDLLGADHVLVGSDWPVAARDLTRSRALGALAAARLTPEETAQVAGGTGAQLLRAGASGAGQAARLDSSRSAAAGNGWTAASAEPVRRSRA